MIACLPMYDWPQVCGATDRLWGAICDRLRAGGIDAPEALSRGPSLWEMWESRDLLLGQTCGMPLRTRLRGRVTLVGTPDYGLPGAPAGYYYSVLVVRADVAGGIEEFLRRTLAFNGQDSQSGWAAPQAHVEPRRFAHTLHTGAHRESALAVVEGRADIAAIDAVTWRLIEAHMPGIAGQLRILARTAPTPGLPLITAPGRDPAPLRRAVDDAITELDAHDRAALGVRGLAMVSRAAYHAVPVPPPPSQDAPAA
jgi:ABC-type phosphate/phosphonate transport system substrate-binding protein